MTHRDLGVATRLTSLVAAAMMVVLLAACGGGSSAAPPVEAPTFDLTIPAGSGDRIAQGEELDILPDDLQATVGETIQIVNEDDIDHVLGPWFVAAGETIRQRFGTPGVFSGFCSVHPEKAFKITVIEA